MDILLLEPVDSLRLASPTPEEEAVLLSKPQEAQVTVTHPSWCE